MARVRVIVVIVIASLVISAFPPALPSIARHAIPPVVAASDDDLALLPPAGWSVTQTAANDGNDATSVSLNQGYCHPNCAVSLTFTPTSGTFPALGSFRVLWSQTSSYGSAIDFVQLTCAGTTLWYDNSGFGGSGTQTYDTGRINVTGTMSPQTTSFSCTWLMHSTFSSGGLNVYTISLWQGSAPPPPGQGVTTSELYGSSDSAMPQVPFCTSGDAVNCATGNFTETLDLMRIPGRGIPLDLTLTYNSLAAPQASPVGYGWSFSYGAHLVIDQTAGTATVVLANGNNVPFTLANGTYTAKPWVIASLTQNGDGTYTYLEKRTQRSYRFSSAGQLLSESDRNGYATTLAYDGSGQLTTVTDPAGRALTFSYDASGRLAGVSDPTSRQVSFSYQPSGDLGGITDVANGVTSFTYDASHLLLTMRDPRNGLLTNGYDSQGRVTSQLDRMNRSTTWSYVSGTTTITDPNNNVTREQFTNNEVTSITRGVGTPEEATWTYAYDATALGVAVVTDPNTHTTHFTWDSSGNLLTRMDALNHTTQYAYDALNDLTSITDPLLVATTFTYDASGNLLTQSRPLAGTNDSQTITLGYGDPAHPGDVTTLTDARSHVWSFSYDAAGDLASATDPLGHETTYGYDGIGRRTSMVSPNGNVAGGNPSQYTTTYAYDAFGDLTSVADPLNHITAAVYDPNRNLSTLTDPDQHTTQYTYDADDELTIVTRADGTTLGNGYDGDGNLTSQTDGNNHSTLLAYDPLDRVKSVTDPLNRVTAYAYDGAGNLTQVTNASQLATTFAYDAANELTGVTYASANTPNVSYGYDAAGRRTSMTDGTGQTTYGYDSLNRLISVLDGAAHQVGYGYDLANNVTALTYPGGNQVSYVFDDANHMSSLTDWLTHTTSFGYDASGNLTQINYPNTTQAAYTYDAANELNQIVDSKAGTTFASFGYTRDPAGLLASTTPTGVSQGNETYTYTRLNQLATVNSGSYAYDPGDNITQVPGANLTYDVADQLQSLAQGTTTTTFGYDAQGNRTSRTSPATGTTTYSYDQANRLIGASIPGGKGVVASGNFHNLAVLGDGTVWGWGRNDFGQLGNGATSPATNPLPVQVHNLAGASAVSAGGYFSMARRSDGTVWAWGNNQYGQLGDGTTQLRSTPVQVSGLSGVTAIASACDTGVALKSDGTVWAWGYNGDGEFGNGTTTNSSTPIQANISGVTAIAAGCFHILALKSDGTMWTWGYNHNGQLGNGSTRDSSVPVQVTGLPSISAIGAGKSHSLAVTTSGAAWAWGYNGAGQLGNNSTRQSSTPVQVLNLTGAKTVAGGGNFSLATTTSGAVWAWGQNNYGQLGNGTTSDSHVPVQVLNLTGASSISAGSDHSLVSTGSGLAFDWGNNQYGQLGNGTTNNSSTAVQVNNLSGVQSQVTASYAYNGDGVRVGKTVNNITETFSWDVSRGVPLMIQDGGTSFLYGPGNLAVEQVDSVGATTYVQHDQLGSSRLLTDSVGNVIGTYTFDAYGATTSHIGTASTPLRFTGQYLDNETGLYYLVARYYDSQSGQFIARDPVILATRQPYAYAENSPLSATDPLGLSCNPTWFEALLDLLPSFSVGTTLSSTVEGGAGVLESGAETYSVYAMAKTLEHGRIRDADNTLLQSGGMFSTIAGDTASEPPGRGRDFPNQSTGGFFGPISGGFFITNATRHEQLLGSFQTIQVDLGVVLGPSFEFSYSGSTVIGSVTYGIGLGAAFTTMQTFTGVLR